MEVTNELIKEIKSVPMVFTQTLNLFDTFLDIRNVLTVGVETDKENFKHEDDTKYTNQDVMYVLFDKYWLP